MKNELDPWEVGIAEQVKGKEFSFDPQAFADFEQLLQAETLGQEPGHRAPEPAGQVMSAGSTTVSLPLILLVVGLACFAAWWLLPQDNAAMSAPKLTTTAPAANPAPSTNIAPAAAPSTSKNPKDIALEVARESTDNTPDFTPASTNQPAAEERQMPTDFTDVEEEDVPRPPRTLSAINSLETLPIQPVTPLKAITIPLPTVQKPTPITRKRDRKALFPDVIKKN